jgi:hypothetical protein
MLKRPGIAATVWCLGFIAVSMILLRQYVVLSPNSNDDIIFASKFFFDSAENAPVPMSDAVVTVKGTLSGEGVANKNNTFNISCEKNRMECSVYSIDQIGRNQVGSLWGPTIYVITKWDAYEIIAKLGDDALDCAKATISLERKSKTALWVQEPINQARAFCKNADNRIYKWTIEDPPVWKAMRK